MGASFSIEEEISRQEKLQEKNNETKVEDNLPTNHFTDTDLQNEWKIFIQNLKMNDIVLYSAINNFIVRKKDENTIEISYPSETAKTEFENVQKEFLNHFKHKVNHFKIKIEYKLSLTLKKEVITKKKIFDKFSDINPVLKTLNELMRFDFS